MSKFEVFEAVSEMVELSKTEVEKVYNAIVSHITTKLKAGEQVTLTGFGTFKVSHRAARTGRNPQTGEAIQIKAADVPVFKAGKPFKEAINK